MSTFEIIATVLLTVLPCAALLIYGRRLFFKMATMAEKLRNILKAAVNKMEGTKHDNR